MKHIEEKGEALKETEAERLETEEGKEAVEAKATEMKSGDAEEPLSDSDDEE